MESLLETIQDPGDLRRLSTAQTEQLAAEIREFLIRNVSRTGGHLSANLGAVELTLALHRVFDTPVDRLVFDVGHQSYVHKIITGRMGEFGNLRCENGISGFPKAEESVYDSFNTGHASTSISAALGMCKARDLRKEKYHVVAVIGDGAMTGGMSYEAMNQAGRDRTPIIVVLNDNEMSIGPNVGMLSRRLGALRTRPSYLQMKSSLHEMLDSEEKESAISRVLQRTKRRIKYFLLTGVFFEELGFTYLGPVDGNDLAETEKVLRQAKNLRSPVLVHVRTVKGKGYAPAEADPAGFHGVGRFDVSTGKGAVKVGGWATAVGEKLVSMAEENEKITAITAAMPLSTGLSSFSVRFPERFFDVGICEEHAVTFAAGLARGGFHPFVTVYSTFLQRAYDQILHDVCLQKLAVTFMVDHAGIVGEDGETHQGIFDIAFLGHIPGMQVLAPRNQAELFRMMEYAEALEGPAAIRYPKGGFAEDMPAAEEPPIRTGEGYFTAENGGARVLLLGLGVLTDEAVKAAELLKKEGIAADAADARFAAPLSEEWYGQLAARYDLIVTVEDHIRKDGFGEQVRSLLYGRTRVEILALPDQFIEQGKRTVLLDRFGLSARGIAASAKEFLKEDSDGKQS